ncbi:MAG: HD domain-containing protein [Bacteroidales bacterium]|nr:HD domain-containing protein [Bacteroidales bacterium]
MSENQDKKELVYRVSSLIRENNELTQQIKDLSVLYDRAVSDCERLESILAQVPKEYLPDGMKFESGLKSLRFKMVTVMYLDIRGFENLTTSENSGHVIDELDQILFHFTDIAEKYKLQIIKTVGYSFMCAGGIPDKNITNPIDVVLAALEMRDYLDVLSKEYEKNNKKFWELRIGIHTGPVTAVATGRKKITYDIKGETVNIASRIAAAAEINKIYVSVYTYELVKEYFITEFNGSLPVKYQGNLDVHCIKRLKHAYSVNRKIGFYPNEVFQVKYALRQFTDLQEVVLDKLEKELPAFLHYHNYRHTIDVVNQVELIGYGEGVDDESILLLKTAALFHDTGNIIGYDNHEYFGTQIARDFLPKWKYTPEQIDKICDLIMATKLPPNPQNLCEKIICDADLDYLGRSDFIPVSNSLYEELKAQGKDIDINTWNINQVKFLMSHQYFTDTAIKLREVGKEFQIERLKKLIEETLTLSCS